MKIFMNFLIIYNNFLVKLQLNILDFFFGKFEDKNTRYKFARKMAIFKTMK